MHYITHLANLSVPVKHHAYAADGFLLGKTKHENVIILCSRY